MAAYETRLTDARREAAGLRAALSQLEKEHRALVNEQVCITARWITWGPHLQRVADLLAYLLRHPTAEVALHNGSHTLLQGTLWFCIQVLP